LTALPAPTYHNWMTPRSQIAAGAILLVGIAGIIGCEDGAKKPVHAVVPGSSIMPLKQGVPATRSIATGATENTSSPTQLPPYLYSHPSGEPC